MMDNQGDIIDIDPLKRIAELEKEIEKLKQQQLNKFSEISNTSENEEKQHSQDDSLPSTSKSTPIEVIERSKQSIEFNKISTTIPDEVLATTDYFGETYSTQNQNDRDQFSVYKKRPGTDDQGKEYEYLMCAYYALKLCFDKNVVDFEITTNSENYGDFDDVALKVTSRNNSTHDFLLQMKHTEQVKGITDKMLSAKKGDFSLLKYFESFQKLQDRDNIICIVFTNRKSKLNDKSQFKLEDESIIVNQRQQQNNHLLIDTAYDDQTAHIFDFEQNGQKLQNFESFFKSFYLFTNQKGSSDIQSHIDKLLYERFGCKVDFIGFMRQWWKGKFVLHKHDVIVKLTELVLSPFVQEIPKNVNEPLSDKAKLLKEATMQFEMTLVKDCDASAVAAIYVEEFTDPKMMSKASLKYGLTTKGLGDLIPQDFTKVLWYLNKVPLIVKYVEKEVKRFRAAIELLAMETDKKKLVLVGHKQEETFSKWRVLESLYDLRNTPLYQDIISKFKVSLQERQSIHLEKFINFDTETAKIIEINDLFLMLEKDLNIGNPLPKLPVAYIPRVLNHDDSLVSEDKALTVFNNPVNIVIGKPGIGKSTLMTYLSHQCPLDYWCVRVNLIKYSKFISEEPSTEEIMNEFLKDEDSLFDKVKATFRQNKRIYLLLDGLDEIDANCVETLLTFVKDISTKGIRVWISSREHLKDEVLNYFKISPITIKKLSEEDQEKYIEQRLCPNSEGVNYTEDEIKRIVDMLSTSVNVIYNGENLLGVPLQLFIITEMFRNDKTYFKRMINEDIFVLTKMYKIFFEGKEKHLYEKAGVQNKEVLDDDLDYKLKRYELPALQASASRFLPLLGLDSKKTSKSQKFLQKIRHKGDPLGIVSQVIGEGNEFRAIFSHQSFAEYFASVWLRKRQGKFGLLKEIFFDDDYKDLRLIFDIMLVEDKPLHLAVLYKDPDQVQKYSNYDGEKDEGGRTALHLLSSNSDDDRIFRASLMEFTPRDFTIYQTLLKKCDPFEKDELFEWNCLDYALCRNSLLLLEVILKETKLNEQRIDINGIIEQFGGFDRLVGSCCFYGYFHLLKTLLDRNACVNIMNIEVDLFPKTTTPLHIASANGNRDIIELLLKKGDKVNLIDEDNWTCLHYACRFGTYDAVINVLELGGDLTAVTNEKQTSLHLASVNGDADIIELLLKKGCRVNVTDQNNWTPLHHACDNKNYDAVMKILERGGDVNAVTNKKQTSLHRASENFNADIIELLLKKGCKVNVTDEDNWTPLHLVCYWGTCDAVTKIIELGGDLNAVTVKKQTPLHFASVNHHPEIIELLLKKGYEINVTDEDNWTPLHLVSYWGTYDAVTKIIELGGDLNAVTNKKQTPLHFASLNYQPEIIELLLKKGYKINVTDEDNWTPLHYACYLGTHEVVMKILELGGDLNAVTDKKFTPLHLALDNGNIDIVKLLLKKGCNVNVADEHNKTPLRYACDEKIYGIIELLLENGAHLDLECRNVLSQNFYDILSHGNVRLIEFLLQRLTDIEINDTILYFPSNFPIHLVTRYGHLQPDLLLKMAELINKYRADTNSSEDEEHFFGYLHKKFDITGEPSSSTLENTD